MNTVLSNPGRALLVAFYCFCFTTLTLWSVNGRFAVTGDEPHYLIMANGIAKYKTFEQTKPYLEEFQTREIYSPGLADRGAVPSPQNTHAAEGPHGLFNAHNIGLPLLIAVPFRVGGTIGVKVFLILMSGLAVWTCWVISGLLSSDIQARVLSVIAVTFGLPLIPAAGQIYPDIPAGIISLIAIASLLYRKHDRSYGYVADLGIGIAISFLPWLHIKFSAAAFVLVIAICWSRLNHTQNVLRSFALAVPLCVSVVMLALYNSYAFGSPSGPYQDGALELSSHAFMVLVGLYVDQFQGMLLQNPAFLVSILFIATFLKRYFWIGIATLVVHLSFVVPNALHPNWYGGGSFAGRFGWAGALTVMPIAIFGLIQVYKYLQSKLYYLFFFLYLIQLNAYVRYTFKDFNLYSVYRPFPDTYPSFIPELRGYTPMLYDSSWAYSYVPNIAFLFLLCSLLLAGIKLSMYGQEKVPYRYWLSLAAMSLVVILGGGTASSYPAGEIFYEGASLPTAIGIVENDSMSAAEGRNSEGFLTFGPYIKLSHGWYKFTLSYDGSDPDGNLGWWDISSVSMDRPLATGEILSGSQPSTIEVEFEVVETLAESELEMRTYWEGEGQLSVHAISIEKI